MGDDDSDSLGSFDRRVDVPNIYLTRFCSIFDGPNKVPQHQREYQAAYRQHVRIWNISPRSRIMIVPYTIVLAGTVGAGLYGMGRKVLGYTSYV
ncbi:hypothetical protein SPBR_09007 [Sporothrix brasiliensis 5110]|uniref:Cytochrome c oxidase subunit 7 n=1 Tax=Sporothrix brasiliensis 5110 TaxID=1398154 RepID=A0A0C2IUM9_9PEZI|nr:uncharacterized protein SPBR_09007 [Sporothrix brasiliensis 5110]KIH88677.1 hypothetical protein SPBR_09007 [Sporothrix brasiliensis 5110]